MGDHNLRKDACFAEVERVFWGGRAFWRAILRNGGIGNVVSTSRFGRSLRECIRTNFQKYLTEAYWRSCSTFIFGKLQIGF